MAHRTPAVDRSLDILELFLGGRHAFTAPEVVSKLGLPRTTVHELLHTLAARGYLERDPQNSSAFRLGLQLFRLGNVYAGQLDLVEVGKVVARKISQESGETVHIAILDKSHVIYVAKVDSTRQVRMVSAEGVRLPAHCTAVGKALLAHEDPSSVRSRFEESGLEAMTDQSITDLSALLDQLEGVRKNGYATEMCESNDDVWCVAAPVRDHTGVVVAGISISVPVQRWSDQRVSEFTDLVRAGAHELSTRLGADLTSGQAG